MPPCTTTITRTIQEDFVGIQPNPSKTEFKEDFSTLWGYFKTPVLWSNVLGIFAIHLLALWTLITFPYLDSWKTLACCFLIGWTSGFGVTGGAHRFWCHRSYKAKTPLKIILMIAFAMSGQNSIHQWVRDHRVHHKYSESDADPHNSKRGFFFSHVGWLMMQKHPQVKIKGRLIECQDVLEEPVAAFFERHFWPMKLFCCFILPTSIPYFFWNESFYWSFCSCIARYVIGLNFTWSVNSVAHIFGAKPYDQRIKPTENWTVAIVAMGEGWHNYHHTFPWDYKAAELSSYRANTTTMLIDCFAKIGWAYDLKSQSEELVRKMISKYGDGTIDLEKHRAATK